jgi:hypothetical protein
MSNYKKNSKYESSSSKVDDLVSLETDTTSTETPKINVQKIISETPSETPSEAPSETPSETPSEAPSQTLSEAPSESPIETDSEAPSETPSETEPVQYVKELTKHYNNAKSSVANTNPKSSSVVGDFFSYLRSLFSLFGPPSGPVKINAVPQANANKLVAETKNELKKNNVPVQDKLKVLGGVRALQLFMHAQPYSDYSFTTTGVVGGGKKFRKSTVQRVMRHAGISGELSTDQRVKRVKKILQSGTPAQKKDLSVVLSNTYKNTVRVYWKNPKIAYNLHPVTFKQYHKLAKKYLVKVGLYTPPNYEFTVNRKTNPYVPAHRPEVKKSFSEYSAAQKSAIIDFLLRTQERKAHKQSVAQKEHTLDMVHSQTKIKTRKNLEREFKEKIQKKEESLSKLYKIVLGMQQKKSVRPSDKILQGYFLLARKEKIIPGGDGSMKRFLANPLPHLVKLYEFMQSELENFESGQKQKKVQQKAPSVKRAIISSESFKKLPSRGKQSAKASEKKKSPSPKTTGSRSTSPARKAASSKDSPKAAKRAASSKDSPKAAKRAASSKDSPKAAKRAASSKDSPKTAKRAASSKDSPKAAKRAASKVVARKKSAEISDLRDRQMAAEERRIAKKMQIEQEDRDLRHFRESIKYGPKRKRKEDKSDKQMLEIETETVESSYPASPRRTRGQNNSERRVAMENNQVSRMVRRQSNMSKRLSGLDADESSQYTGIGNCPIGYSRF